MEEMVDLANLMKDTLKPNQRTILEQGLGRYETQPGSCYSAQLKSR